MKLESGVKLLAFEYGLWDFDRDKPSWYFCGRPSFEALDEGHAQLGGGVEYPEGYGLLGA